MKKDVAHKELDVCSEEGGYKKHKLDPWHYGPLKSPNDKSLLSLSPPSISSADYPWRSGPLKACHWPSCSSFAFGDTLENYSWFLALAYRHTKEA